MSNSAITGPTLIDFPAGMVMPYAGSTTPAGWLECNGSEVDISAYPALAAALGSTWNTAKNPLTGANYAAPAAGKFRVPDMRGAFLRGSSGGVNNAQGVATGLAEFQAHKTAKNGLSNQTSSLSALGLNASSVSGTVGGSDGTHVHKLSHAYNNLNIGGGGGGLGGFGTTETYFSDNVETTGSGHGHSFSQTAAAQSLASSTVAAQTIQSADAETRPDAVGVRYLIKF